MQIASNDLTILHFCQERIVIMKQSLTSGRTGPQIMALCNNWFQGIVHWDMPLADLPQVRSGMSFRSFVQLMSWARFILKHYLRRLKKESRAILLCAKHYTQKIKAIALEGIEHFEGKNCHKRSLRFFFNKDGGDVFSEKGGEYFEASRFMPWAHLKTLKSIDSYTCEERLAWAKFFRL